MKPSTSEALPAAEETKGKPLSRLLSFRVWLSSRFRYTDFQVTLLWAGLVGVLGGLAAVAFRATSDALRYLMTHQGGEVVVCFAKLLWWQRLIIPALGGVAAGLVFYFGKKLGKSQNTTDYMEAVVIGNGQLAIRSSVVKSLSALFSISSGGSIGREGPMVQVSALTASLVGSCRRNWSVPRRRLIVACGAAAGIASAYNAPIAGALFVSEIVLKSISMETLGPLVFSSVLATLVFHCLRGTAPLYPIEPFVFRSSWELIPYLSLGVLAGFVAPLFLKTLRLSKRLFSRLPLPIYGRMALGGLAVGALAILHPEVCGNGYSVVSSILTQHWIWQTLAVVLLLKALATCATFGSGAVGGVFTPTLFVGASLGYLLGALFHAIGGGAFPPPGAFALVGMGAFLAATTHAPLMAMVIVCEMTADFQLILPLMLCCVLAYYISHALERQPMYDNSRKSEVESEFMRQISSLRVGDLMHGEPLSVKLDARLDEIAQCFISHNNKYLYVTDDSQLFKGVIALYDIKPYLNRPELERLVIARDLMHNSFPTMSPQTSLSEALEKFTTHDGERLPVIDDDHTRLIGVISKSDVLLALAQKHSASIE